MPPRVSTPPSPLGAAPLTDCPPPRPPLPAGAGPPAPAMSRLSRSAAVRLACGLLLVAVLLWRAVASDTLESIVASPPRPDLFALAYGAIVVSLTLSFVRWRLIAAAAGVPMSLGESLRFGAIGFACNFVALGNIGGDVVKATLLARGRPGLRARAVSTVVIDRLMGLFGFLVYASAAIWLTGAAGADSPAPLRVLCRATLLLTAAAAVALFAPLCSERAPGWVAGRLVGVRLLGPLAAKVAAAAQVYRSGRRWLFAAIAVGMVVNAVFIASFYAAAASLPMAVPSLRSHLFIVPQSLIAGAAPISPNGLGTMEATTEFLYRQVRPETPVGVGTLAALAHRVAMLLAGVTAVAYYYAAPRREADAAISQASASAVAEEGSGTPPPAAASASRQTV